MGRIVIVNGSTRVKGYWDNKVEGDTLILKTHCAAAIVLAEAATRIQDQIFLNQAGEQVSVRGPIKLVAHHRERDFFALHFSGISQIGRPSLQSNAQQVQKWLRAGQHVVVCEGREFFAINLESPQPSSSDVELVLGKFIAKSA